MKTEARAGYVTRETILKLLSDDEIARVGTAETKPMLSIGDDYVDLEQLDRGVQQAMGETSGMGRVLPRTAVREDTWHKIQMLLSPHN